MPFRPSALPPFRPSPVPPFRRSPFRPSALPPFRPSAVPPFCRSALPPFPQPYCRSAFLSLCRSAVLPFCRSAVLPFCRFAILPFLAEGPIDYRFCAIQYTHYTACGGFHVSIKSDFLAGRYDILFILLLSYHITISIILLLRTDCRSVHDVQMRRRSSVHERKSRRPYRLVYI
jgi:hypothetical protein